MTDPQLSKQLRTVAVHAGRSGDDALVAPIHRSSTYKLGEPETFDDIRYIRLNNTPSQLEVEAAIGTMEGGSALVVPSGTAAVHLALSLFEPGDHVIAPRRLYGGTRKLLDHHAERMGLRATFVDVERPETWASAVEADTRGFFVETIANPWMSIPDLEAVARFCRSKDLLSIVDSTLATPVLYQPRRRGFDVVLHSASKHLNGHSDVVAGVLVAGEARALTLRRLANKLGICPDPQACFLLRRGIKTLPLRVRAQCESALRLAQWLDQHDGIESVNYPGLEQSPHRERAASLFPPGLFGTMLSFVPKTREGLSGLATAKALIESLRIPMEAPSLGGVETLVTRPATTSHAGLSAEYRQSIGIDDAMIRVSVGLEASEDLIADFDQALSV